jgi:putative nucleotidyltransferase with HDIG domain
LNYTAALLHDIGKSAINTAPRDEILQIVHLRDREGHSGADAELEVLGVDHAEVGGIMLNTWNLPPELVSAVRYHHAPEFDTGPLASLVHIANACAVVGNTSKDWDDFENRLNPHVLDLVGLALAEVKDCWPAVVEDVHSIENQMWS